MAKIPHSKIKISHEFAVLKDIQTADQSIQMYEKKHRSSEHIGFLCNANAETTNSSERDCKTFCKVHDVLIKQW